MRSLVLPWLHFWAFFPVSVISVCDPGLPDLRSLNLCLWPRPLPGIVYVSALPLIFLLCPLTIACVILPLSNKYILLHLDPLPLTSLYIYKWTALLLRFKLVMLILNSTLCNTFISLYIFLYKKKKNVSQTNISYHVNRFRFFSQIQHFTNACKNASNVYIPFGLLSKQIHSPFY